MAPLRRRLWARSCIFPTGLLEGVVPSQHLSAPIEDVRAGCGWSDWVVVLSRIAPPRPADASHPASIAGGAAELILTCTEGPGTPPGSGKARCARCARRDRPGAPWGPNPNRRRLPCGDHLARARACALALLSKVSRWILLEKKEETLDRGGDNSGHVGCPRCRGGFS